MVQPYQSANQFSQNPSIFATDENVIATYTVDYRYVTSYELDDNTERKYLAVGTVVALDPTTEKIIPNFTSYTTYPTVLGVLAWDADCGIENQPWDDVVPVVVRGYLYADYCYDSGTYGAVLESTRNCLKERIQFVDDRDDVYYEGGDPDIMA